MKIKINCDVFNIVDRLKQIDEGYYVIFNTNIKKFEIHNSNTKNSYCLTIPYRQLDKRTLELVEKTHIKNYNNIIKNIDENNSRKELENIENIKQISDYKIRELLRYSKINAESIGIDAFSTTWM